MVRTIAIGHLGSDCNLNSVNGKNVINFSVAHSEKFKDAQGVQKERTLWISCAYWSEKTGIAQYLKKGQQVYVEGEPSVTTYMDRQNKPQAEFKLRVNQIQLLGSANRENQSGGGYAQSVGNPNGNYAPQSSNDITEPVDDIPF